jgi:hypothetical protein
MSLPSFFSSRAIRIVTLLILFSAALAIRLYDLTDLPLDFHPTRQLLSAIKARALYFKTQPDGISTEHLETGIRQAKLKAQVEPVIFERLVSYTYRFTGEQLWIARIYSSLFWLIGGVFLFLLVRDLISFDAAVFSTAYYLFFPYAIIASRSFQPDPLMVMFILAFWWVFARWMQIPSWTHAVLAGLLGGLAIFIKFSAAFFVIGVALGLALSRFTLRDLLRNGQVWVMAILGALPGLIYLLYGLFIEGGLGGQFKGRFIPSLLVNPLHYLQWMAKVDLAVGGLFVMLALLGFFLTTDKRLRSLLWGLWSAYLLYSIIFNYLVATHDYYHLPLLPIVAVSLSPLGGWFFARLAESTVQGYARTAAYVILGLGLIMSLWNVRNQMKAVDYRRAAAMWTEIGDLVYGKRVVALTQDYGSRLEYWGWLTPDTWPSIGEMSHSIVRGGKIDTFDRMFDRYTGKRDLFLVTDFDEFKAQTQLREKLSFYNVYAEGEGYIIYSLR